MKKIYIIFAVAFSMFFMLPSTIRAEGECIAAIKAANGGSANLYSAAKNADKILPLIPNFLNATPDPSTPTVTPCTPSLWDSNVLKFFVFKSLFILNWLAEALFIILILYSGVLYIMGYMDEGNVKKAKTTMKAAITGLLIVLAARYIVDGAIILFSDDTSKTTITNNDFYK